MTLDRMPQDDLIASWSVNAGLWTQAVRAGAIASRREATDAAILDAATRRTPRKLLDVGCGEGWLCRALGATGAAIAGVDVSPELIAAAKAGGDARYLCSSYATIIARPEALGVGFDTIVCNFSLLDDRAPCLLETLARIAAPCARLIIQTVHPLTAGPPYADGWRIERFEAFGDGAWTAMPWYFRTMASWSAAFVPGWTLRAIEEPRAPAAALPASLLLIAERTASDDGEPR